MENSLKAEAKNPEKEYQHSAEFLELLINSTPAPIFYKNGEGKYLGCNEVFAKEIIGLPKEEIIGKVFSELHVGLPEALEFHEPDIDLLLEGKSKRYELKFRCADDESRDFIVTQNAFKAGRDEATILVGVMQDVTEQKQAEEARQNNISFLETLQDNIPNPVFQRDMNGVYISCNESFTNLIMGLPKKKVIGTTFMSHNNRMNEKIIEIYHRDNELLFRNGGSHHYEAELQCSDGIERTFLITKAAYNDNSRNMAGIAGVMTDITERKKAEEELKKKAEELSEAKKRLDLALEATKMGTWEWDVESNTMKWDDNLFSLTGISRQEFDQTYKGLIGLSNKIIFPEDRKRMQEALQKVREDKTDIYEFEHGIIRPDGSIHYFSVKGRACRNSEGKLLRINGTTHDITDRKKAEKALKDSDERYRIASEQTGQIIYDMDLHEGLIDWAGAIEEVTGYNPEEFRDSNLHIWWEHIHPDDRKRVIKRFKEFQNQGKEKFWSEYRLRKKDGSYYYVEDIGVFLKDENGKVYRSIGVHKDISERKLTEKKLQESEERYRSFIQNFKGIAYRLDTDYKPLFMGGDVEKITGYSPETFLSGKIRWEELVEPEDRPFMYEKSKELCSIPNRTEEWEYRIRHRDGKVRWVHEIIQNLCDEIGTPKIIQGSIYDITEQKIAEEKLRKAEEMRKKEIHHRVKNNLQVICSLLELQADKFNDPKVQEAFRESQNRIISMSIIHEELYRDQNGKGNGNAYKNGKGNENKETIDIATYLKRLTDELVRTYVVESEGLDLKLDVDRVFLGIDTSIPLGILINELVSNALKHAFSEGIEKKKIEIGVSETGNEEYFLTFSDNGTGLPEGFDFRNTDSLGLQLVNALTDQLEGSIKLESGPKGTKYSIKFRDIG